MVVDGKQYLLSYAALFNADKEYVLTVSLQNKVRTQYTFSSPVYNSNDSLIMWDMKEGKKLKIIGSILHPLIEGEIPFIEGNNPSIFTSSGVLAYLSVMNHSLQGHLTNTNVEVENVDVIGSELVKEIQKTARLIAGEFVITEKENSKLSGITESEFNLVTTPIVNRMDLGELDVIADTTVTFIHSLLNDSTVETSLSGLIGVERLFDEYALISLLEKSERLDEVSTNKPESMESANTFKEIMATNPDALSSVRLLEIMYGTYVVDHVKAEYERILNNYVASQELGISYANADGFIEQFEVEALNILENENNIIRLESSETVRSGDGFIFESEVVENFLLDNTMVSDFMTYAESFSNADGLPDAIHLSESIHYGGGLVNSTYQAEPIQNADGTPFIIYMAESTQDADGIYAEFSVAESVDSVGSFPLTIFEYASVVSFTEGDLSETVLSDPLSSVETILSETEGANLSIPLFDVELHLSDISTNLVTETEMFQLTQGLIQYSFFTDLVSNEVSQLSEKPFEVVNLEIEDGSLSLREIPTVLYEIEGGNTSSSIDSDLVEIDFANLHLVNEEQDSILDTLTSSNRRRKVRKTRIADHDLAVTVPKNGEPSVGQRDIWLVTGKYPTWNNKNWGKTR